MNNWNVINLRRLWEQSKTLSRKELAMMYGVTEKQMWYILKYKAKKAAARVGVCA